MKYLRSPEIRKELLICGLFTALAVVLSLFWVGGKCALAVALCCIVFVGVIIWNNYRRCRRVERMGEQIDRILHGEEISLMENCVEGELAILSNQIQKMVRRLKEQRDILSKEKHLLADSMADISHQMKTPLTSIHLILSFLGEENLTWEKRQEYVQELAKLTGRMDWMVYAMLKMAKLDAGTVTLQKEEFSMNQLIKNAYDSLAIPLDIRGIAFEKDVEEGACMTGDIVWMTEAVTNVMKNCMEHTPSGGKIHVTVRDNPLFTKIVITDTGKGIAPEDLPHIFERFYRGKDADSSSVGIGLALSRRIILEQNGTIKAENRRGESGAMFEIRCYKGAV